MCSADARAKKEKQTVVSRANLVLRVSLTNVEKKQQDIPLHQKANIKTFSTWMELEMLFYGIIRVNYT